MKSCRLPFLNSRSVHRRLGRILRRIPRRCLMRRLPAVFGRRRRLHLRCNRERRQDRFPGTRLHTDMLTRASRPLVTRPIREPGHLHVMPTNRCHKDTAILIRNLPLGGVMRLLNMTRDLYGRRRSRRKAERISVRRCLAPMPAGRLVAVTMITLKTIWTMSLKRRHRANGKENGRLRLTTMKSIAIMTTFSMMRTLRAEAAVLCCLFSHWWLLRWWPAL